MTGPDLRLAVPALTVWLVTAALLHAGAVAAAVAAVAAAVVALPLWRAGRRPPYDRTRSGSPYRWLAPWPAGCRRGTGRTWARMAAGVLVCTAGAALLVAFRIHSAMEGPVAEAASAERTVRMEAVLAESPRLRMPRKGLAHRPGIAAKARVESLDGEVTRATVVVLAQARGWRGLLPSQRFRFTARLVPGDRADLVSALALARGRPSLIGAASPVQRAAARVRSGLRDACDQLPDQERGLLPGLVVGDTSRLDERLAADFQTAGLSHLNAVSGANLAIVGGAALTIAAAIGLSLVARSIVIALAMVAFAIIAQLEPSVLRALVMGLTGALALGSGRSRQGLAALSFAVLVLVVISPTLAVSGAFTLSVAATAGLILIAPRWRDRLRRHLPSFLAEAVAVAAAAQVAVTPFLIFMSGEVSLIAIPANLFAAAAVPPATLLGFAAAVTSLIHPGIAGLLAGLAAVPCRWIVLVAEHAAALPGAAIGWPGGLLGVGLLICTAGAVAIAVHRRRLRYLIAFAGAGALAGWLLLPAGWPPSGWVLVACDIGQGDMIVMSGGAGTTVVVDAGPDPPLADRCLRDLGVHRVDLLVITHFHADHVGGIPGVARRRTIGAVLATHVAEPEAESRRARAALRGVPLHAPHPGQIWRFPALTLRVLAPDEYPPTGGSVPNNASVVAHAQWRGVSALLTGDIETEAQAVLDPPRADVLKIPHHGSGRRDPALPEEVGARAALISVGRDNGYGHPSPGLIRSLNALGSAVYRTDRDGDIAVTEGLSVVTAK